MVYTSPMAFKTSNSPVRIAVALVGAVIFPLLIFKGVAAFNDVMKMFAALPVASSGPKYTCPQGLALHTFEATGKAECIPAPSTTEGVVSVGIYKPREKPAADVGAPASSAPPTKPR